jgi:hypothetical protein
MKILISLVLLALISCGGGGGGGQGVSSNLQNTQNQPGTGTGFENLQKFKNSVAQGQWAQYAYLNGYNYFKFKYRDQNSTSGCQPKNIWGIVTINFCLNSGTADPNWIPAWTTEEKNNLITNPLPIQSAISGIVSGSHLNSDPECKVINPTVPCAYFDGYQWIIVKGTETFAINPGIPLGGNPTYYKNTSTGKEYSLAIWTYEYKP